MKRSTFLSLAVWVFIILAGLTAGDMTMSAKATELTVAQVHSFYFGMTAIILLVGSIICDTIESK